MSEDHALSDHAPPHRLGRLVVEVLMRELTSLYTPLPRAGPPPWQNCPSSMPTSQVATQQAARRLAGTRALYWRQQLAGAACWRCLPIALGPAVQTFARGHAGARPAGRAASALERLNQSSGVTLYMTLLAAFQRCCRVTPGKTTSWSARRSPTATVRKSKALIGFFVNTPGVADRSFGQAHASASC